ncbi:hypothetical protein ACLB2K_047597 [Fragaria x ananassa]
MQGLSSSSHNLSIKERTSSEGRPGALAFDPPMPKSVSRCRPLRGESDCAWLARLSLLSVAGRCAGESVRAWLARLSLCGESVRAWLATVAIEHCGPLPWRVISCLVGKTVAIERCVHCVGDSLLSVAVYCPGESVSAWLVTVAIERCGRCVASQSALGWGDSLLSVAGHCPGESVRAWLATVAIERCGGQAVAGNSRVRGLLSGWLGLRGLLVSSIGLKPGRGGGTRAGHGPRPAPQK